jgi:hypothetical protein
MRYINRETARLKGLQCFLPCQNHRKRKAFDNPCIWKRDFKPSDFFYASLSQTYVINKTRGIWVQK